MTDTFQTPPAAAPPPVGAPPTAPHLDKFAGQMEGVQAADAAALEQRNAAMLKPMSALSNINAQPMPQPPTPQKMPPAPDAKEYQKDAMAFASAMAVLGAVAGRFTRAPGSASLNAFAGALKGWQTGNLQAYESAAKQWEQNTKATIENNRQVMEKYKLALDNRKMSIDQQMSQIQLIASQFHDQMMYDAAAAKNYTLVAQIYEKNAEFTQKAEESAARLQQRRDEQSERTKSSANYWVNHPEEFGKLPPSQQATVKQLMEIHKLGFEPGAEGGGSLSGDTLKQMVDRRLAGDKSVTTNIGRGAQGSANIAAFNNALAAEMQTRGMSGADLAKADQQYVGGAAYQRTAGTQSARVEVASNEVEQLLPQAIETSRALPRGKFMPLNKLIQSWEQQTSDPAYNDFILANFSLINAYTRAMNPQGVPRVAERLEQKAVGILSTATSPEAYEVQAQRLWKEVQASKKAVATTAEGRKPGDINAPVPWDKKPGGDDGWSVKEK